MASSDRPRRTGAGYVVIGTLVAGVLVGHVLVRLHALSKRPAAMLLAEYPQSYSRALSILGGTGNARLPLTREPPSLAVRRFLDGEVDGLSPADWNSYLASRPSAGELGCYQYVDLGRIGELYTAALLWKVFGIRWSVLQYCYVGLSTLACLAIMLMGWRMGRSPAAGILAGALFAASHVEATQAMRDNHATWFAALASCGFVFLTPPARSRWVEAVAAMMLGGAVNLGYFWRPTVLLVAVFFLVCAAIRWMADGRGWRRALQATGCCLAGFAASLLLASLVTPGTDRVIGGGTFHVAYFGGFVRGNLLGTEDALQIAHDDSKVAADAFAFSDARTPHAPIAYLDAAYGATCRTMYFEALRINLYHWVSGIPRVLLLALTGCSRDGYLLAACFLCGATALASPRADRPAIATMIAFFLYFTAIWFALSPEMRHWSMLLIPLCAVGGLAALVPGMAYAAVQSRRGWPVQSAQMRLPVISGGCVVLLWLGASGAAYLVSAAERRACLDAVREAREQPSTASCPIDDPRTFFVHVPGDTAPARHGYLLEIEAGEVPGELICRHLRMSDAVVPLFEWENNGDGSDILAWARKTIWWNACLETRHRLRPGTRQRFVVTCLRSATGGDPRSYSLRVSLEGDARISRAERLDLSAWKRLPLSTVFVSAESAGVTPYVGGGPTARGSSQFTGSAPVLETLGFPELIGARR